MMKVKQDDLKTLSGYAAGAAVAYGMFVARSADNVVKESGTGYEYIGVACDREVINEDKPGFYETYEPIEIKPNGIAHVWLMGGLVATAGDYLKLGAGGYGATTERLGYTILDTTGQRTVYSVARVIGGASVGSADFDQVLVGNAAAGDLTLTLDAGKITALALVPGDYIVIDSDAAQEVNRVVSTTTTTITLQNPCAAAYTTAAAGTVYKLVQVKVLLL